MRTQASNRLWFCDGSTAGATKPGAQCPGHYPGQACPHHPGELFNVRPRDKVTSL